MDRKLFVFAVLVSGCTFKVGGAPLDGPMGDVDQATVTDLAEEVADMTVPPDFTGLDLLGVDFATPPPDLTTPPDMTPPFSASHVGPTYFNPAASDLTNIVEIDTGTLQLKPNGGPPGAPPSGITFAKYPGQAWAVLTVGGWTVNLPVTVKGPNALIVVASKAITLNAMIDGSATLDVPGPGGALAAMGGGAGTNGVHFMNGEDSGGGGAGFGSVGGVGGAKSPHGQPLGGPVHGTLITQFGGGSGGGAGGDIASCNGAAGRGGGGGGGIQLSSAVSITINAAGGIDVGGGGGRGGCDRDPMFIATSGGGGGSGGEIFLEAPTITHAGTLAANGGGGGAGATFKNGDGQSGGDGTLAATAGATGGAVSAEGGNGGAGGFGASNAGPGGTTATDNGGGGGGGYGYIWFRTRNTDPTLTMPYVITPAAGINKTL